MQASAAAFLVSQRAGGLAPRVGCTAGVLMPLGEFSRVWKRTEPRLSKQTGLVTVPALFTLIYFTILRRSSALALVFFFYLCNIYLYVSPNGSHSFWTGFRDVCTCLKQPTSLPPSGQRVRGGTRCFWKVPDIQLCAATTQAHSVARARLRICTFYMVSYGTIHTTHGDNRGVMTG